MRTVRTGAAARRIGRVGLAIALAVAVASCTGGGSPATAPTPTSSPTEGTVVGRVMQQHAIGPDTPVVGTVTVRRTVARPTASAGSGDAGAAFAVTVVPGTEVRTRSNPVGAFTLRVVPGPYVLTTDSCASGPSDTALRSIEVRAGATRRVDLWCAVPDAERVG